jgi:hypothetical protein
MFPYSSNVSHCLTGLYTQSFPFNTCVYLSSSLHWQMISMSYISVMVRFWYMYSLHILMGLGKGLTPVAQTLY